MAEFKPSAMQQIIEALGRVKQEMEGGSLTRALLHLNTAEAAARAMQEQQAGVPWWKDPRNFEIAGAMIEAERRGQVHAGAASPSAPPVAGDERARAASEGLAAHAIEELCQLGYTVRDGQLIPPDNLHELARVAGWASPSGERARPVAGVSVQQPTRAMLAFWLNAMEKAHEDCTNQKQLAEAIAEVRAVIQQAAQPEVPAGDVTKPFRCPTVCPPLRECAVPDEWGSPSLQLQAIRMTAWNIVSRYAALEKKAGRTGDWQRAQRIAAHVRRSASLHGFAGNPY